MDAATTIIGMLKLPRLERTFRLRDFLLMLQPKILATFLKISKFGE